MSAIKFALEIGSVTRIIVPVALGWTFAFAPSSGDAQIVRSGAGYKMRAKYVKGTVMKYTIAATYSMGGSGTKSQPIEMPMSLKVIDVKGGVGTVQFQLSMPGGGKPMEGTVKMDAQGRAVGKSNPMLQGVGSVFLPDKVLKVGDTWTSTSDSPSVVGDLKAKTTYRFKGIKSVKGKQVAELTLSSSGASKGIKMSGSGTMLLLVSDASLFSLVTDQKLVMDSSTIPMHVKVTRS
jgi:hypothetical protein